MRNYWRILLAILLVVGLSLVAVPVHAIGNPNTITFGATPTYEAFYNVTTGGVDMLFFAEVYVKYAVTPNDYTPSEAFLFEVLNEAGTVVLVSTPIKQWGDRPVGIYLSAANVTTLGLVANSAYKFRITGNPLIFPVLTEGVNMRTVPLVLGNWADQSLATDSLNVLREFVVGVGAMQGMVFHINTTDTPTTPYYVQSGGLYYLNNAGTPSGQNLFLEGVPGLDVFCPSVFNTSVSPIDVAAPPTTGAAESTISVTARLGTTINRTVDALTTFLGLSPTTGGKAVTKWVITLAILVALIYWLTKHGLQDTRILGVIALAGMGICTYMGLFPLGAMFVIVIVLAFFAVYYFLTRGIL